VVTEGSSSVIPDERVRVLVTGLPRSGTSWAAGTLRLSENCLYVPEPDNEKMAPFAMRAKRRIGRFPVLSVEEAAPLYEVLWDHALGMAEDWQGVPTLRRVRVHASKLILKNLKNSLPPARLDSVMFRGRGANNSLRLRLAKTISSPAVPLNSSGHVIAKSVHALMALEWIAARWNPKIVVVMRHPLNVLASWMDARVDLHDRDRQLDTHPKVLRRYVIPWGISTPGPNASVLARAAWHLGLLASVMEATLARNPSWHVLEHEWLCDDPHANFRRICQELGLRWSRRQDEFLSRSDRPGRGYELHRVASEQRERWRLRLTADEVDEALQVLASFPLGPRCRAALDGTGL
jgi:hypothetical protein